MIHNLSTYLVIKLLRNSNLTLENRVLLTTALLDELKAIPATDIIKFTEQGIVVNDRLLDLEGARLLRESAKATMDSQARKFVQEQVNLRAVTLGVHNGDTPEKLMFARAAIWQGQQQEELLKILASE